MHKIKKTFHMAYAHRLLNYKGKCENLHGHNGIVEITLKAAKLNHEKMVMDFTDLGKTIKSWLDENMDHKVILCKADPLAKVLRSRGQSCFLTADNPTAETFAKIIFLAAAAMKLPVDEVAFWETPTSMALYRK